MLLSVFGDTLGGVDMYQNFEHPRFWIGPLVSVLVAVFLVILLFNLLIAVMSEVSVCSWRHCHRLTGDTDPWWC